MYARSFDSQKQHGDSATRQKELNSKESNNYYSKAQETICSFFLASMKKASPEWVLQQFDNLFISQTEPVNPQISHALYTIIRENKELIFRDTLKRSCYILINNWSATRYHQYIQEIVQLFSKLSDSQNILSTLSPTKKRLKEWLKKFLQSEDYQELNLFIARYNQRDKRPWSNRYASYLLATQSLDSKKPREQREAAKVIHQQLKEQFKFDLAMYTARSHLGVASVRSPKNPTVLGDDVLRLIQKILEKRGTFGYTGLANIFIKQVEGLLYKQVKQSLVKYLFFNLESSDLLESLEIYLSNYLKSLNKKHDEEVWNSHLLLRTCNRLIEYLTTPTQGKPSQIFTLLAIRGESFTLAILLLKIILISRNSYIHLESCLGYLIYYYEDESEAECQWLISFLETIKITLTIYAENIRYNLVSIEANDSNVQTSDNLNSYRVFSQAKVEHKNGASPRKSELLTFIDKLLKLP